MKVLIISNMYPSEQKPYSGVFVLNQYNYLKNKANTDIDLFAMKRTFTSKLGSILKYLKFYLIFFPKLFKKYDVIHVHFFGYHVILAYIYKLFRPKTNVVVTFHGNDTFNIKKGSFKFLLKKINHIVAVGKDQQNYIYEHSKFKSIFNVSAGVNADVFYKEDGIEKKYDFIFVGSFYDIKGIDIFIHAIAKIENDQNSYCFVGSGQYLNDLKKLGKSHKVEIKQNQTQDQIRGLLNESKFLVLPSRGDSFGLVVTEALFCGTPAIVSNFGGVKDQVKDKLNGYLVENESVDDLFQKLQFCSTLDEAAYSGLVKEALVSNKEHSLESICKQLLKIYAL